MVKKFIFQLIVQNKDLIFKYGKQLIQNLRSTKNFQNTNSQANTNTNENSNQQSDSNNDNNEKNKSSFKFSMQNLITTPMTKKEALKILDLDNKTDVTSKDIIERFEKLMQMNDLQKGGSFYIQNKIYYAKEFLIVDFPKEDNISEYNPKI